MKKLSLMFLCVASFNLWAVPFSNQYCQFELPATWSCVLEGAEYVCQSENADRKKEAIIILAAKERGAKDSMADYQAYLKEAKTFSLPGGKTQVSEAKYVKLETINNQQWVDSLHLASEVPGFYTRYLATVKEDLGVAVTFSVAKDLYESYQPVFDQVVQTLRVFRTKNTSVSDFKLKKGDENLLDSAIPTDLGDAGVAVVEQKKNDQTGAGGAGGDMTLYYLLGGAVVVFVLIRAKKKK